MHVVYSCTTFWGTIWRSTCPKVTRAIESAGALGSFVRRLLPLTTALNATLPEGGGVSGNKYNGGSGSLPPCGSLFFFRKMCAPMGAPSCRRRRANRGIGGGLPRFSIIVRERAANERIEILVVQRAETDAGKSAQLVAFSNVFRDRESLINMTNSRNIGQY